MNIRQKIGDAYAGILERTAFLAEEEDNIPAERGRAGSQISPDAVQYNQWFETDPERLETEKRAMEQHGFEPMVYPDGRLIFTGQLLGNEVLAILDYLYPLKPPALYLLTETISIPQKLLNEDGSIDLLRAGKCWDPNTMMTSTMIDLLQQLLVFCEDKSTKSDDNKGDDT